MVPHPNLCPSSLLGPTLMRCQSPHPKPQTLNTKPCSHLPLLRALVLDGNLLHNLPLHLTRLASLRELSCERNRFKQLPSVLTSAALSELMLLSLGPIPQPATPNPHPKPQTHILHVFVCACGSLCLFACLCLCAYASCSCARVLTVMHVCVLTQEHSREPRLLAMRALFFACHIATAFADRPEAS